MTLRVYTGGALVQVIDESIVSPAAIVSIGLVFAVAGMCPWAFAQTFKRGDVPASAQLVADCASFQYLPWTFYDDGSVRAAHVAGYCAVAAPGRVDVRMRAGAPIAAPLAPRVAHDLTVTLDGIAAVELRRKVIAHGPVMLHEQVFMSGGVVYEQRSFANGEVELLPPTIENTAFLLASTARTVVARVVLGGQTRFNEPVTVRHHTRVMLVRGNAWSYWVGARPVLPDHDHAYLCASESFPPYVIGAAVLPTALGQSFAPNFLGESGGTMGATGYSPRIGLLARSNVYYLTTGGAKAWNYMLAEAFSAGSWSIHFRDENTDALPRFATHPTRSVLGGSIPRGGGGESHALPVDTSHQPSSQYAAALVTGWQWFVDEHLAWTAFNHFYQQPTIRQNERGILRPDVGANQDRGCAWGLRTLAQAIALTPSSHPLYADLLFAWRENMRYARARYVDGTIDGGRYVNNLGIFAPYSSVGTSLYTGADRGTSVAWWGSAWMQSFITQALGHAVHLALPAGAQTIADTRAAFMQSAKLVVGLTGTDWNWQRMGPYAMPFFKDGTKTPVDATNAWFAGFSALYAEYCTAKGLQALPTALTIKRHSTETDVYAGDWQVLHLGKQWPALTYAVMHGAPGAAASLARVMSSPSFQLIARAVDEPQFAGMMPPGFKHPGAL